MSKDNSPFGPAGEAALRPLGSSRRNQWRVNAEHVDMVRERAPRPLSIPAAPRSLRIDASRTALIIVDMQNDFCHPQGWLASIGVDIAPARMPIEPLSTLLPAVRSVDIPVIWVNWGNRPDRLNISPALLHVYDPHGDGCGLGAPLPGTGSRVLEQDAWSAAIVDELTPAGGDILVSKYRMSGFWDTPLDSILRNLDVSTVIFAGVNLDQCVMCTLQDAHFLGYDCLLLRDCSATTSPAYCREASLYNVQQCFGFVIDSTDLGSAL